jgi:broad specificity phosphatase PhoE
MPPKAPKIMVIRHAEKPTDQTAGVKQTGESSSHDLIVRGWQRAGALACLFAPARGPLQDPLLAMPEFIFASAAADDPDSGNSRSRRSQETVMPLAQLLRVEVNLNFSKGQEVELAAAARQCSGPVLIAWQHENIRAIAQAILGDDRAPQNWPGGRFDLVFVFTLNPVDGTYSFVEVMQRLLAGDSADPI